MKRQLKPEDTHLADLTVKLQNHIIRDLKEMERNSHQTVDEIVTKALLMFIATHSDYLARLK